VSDFDLHVFHGRDGAKTKTTFTGPEREVVIAAEELIRAKHKDGLIAWLCGSKDEQVRNRVKLYLCEILFELDVESWIDEAPLPEGPLRRAA
jgi:hypothetical protein